MKVLVIGGAGYIGSHVVKALMQAGHECSVFDNFRTGLRENLFPKNGFIHGDILSQADLDEAFSKKFDAFIHLAALKAAGESMIQVEKYAKANITGSVNILNAAMKHGCKYAVFSSSAAVYGSPEDSEEKIDESHPKNPENFYGYTKLSIEGLMSWYSKLKPFHIASLRYFNAAGYDVEGKLSGLEQNPANLIPVVMEVAMGKRDVLEIFGDDYDTPDGTCIRDYVHVNDLAEAHVKALHFIYEKKQNIEVNLGSEKGTSVKEILEASRRITGRKIEAKIAPRREGDPARLVASSRKAKELLGWKAGNSSIDVIIKSTWQAYNK